MCISETMPLDSNGNPVLNKKGKPTVVKDNWYIRFTDTCGVLQGKLEELVKNLPKEQFKTLRQKIPNEEKLKLVLRKGAFPTSGSTISKN